MVYACRGRGVQGAVLPADPLACKGALGGSKFLIFESTKGSDIIFLSMVLVDNVEATSHIARQSLELVMRSLQKLLCLKVHCVP